MQKGSETTKMVDSTIKGTTYEGENREKKRGIYEKRKLKKGEVERIENKRVEEKIRREKRKIMFLREEVRCFPIF